MAALSDETETNLIDLELSPISELTIVEPNLRIQLSRSSISEYYSPIEPSCDEYPAELDSPRLPDEIIHSFQISDSDLNSNSFISPISITDVQTYTTNPTESDYGATMTNAPWHWKQFKSATPLANPTRQLVCINPSPSCSSNPGGRKIPALSPSSYLPNADNSTLQLHYNVAIDNATLDTAPQDTTTGQEEPSCHTQSKPFRESIYMLGAKVASNAHSPFNITKRLASKIRQQPNQPNIDSHSFKEFARPSMRSLGSHLFHTVTNATLKAGNKEVDHRNGNGPNSFPQTDSPSLDEVVAYMKTNSDGIEKCSKNAVVSPLDRITSFPSAPKLTKMVQDKWTSKRNRSIVDNSLDITDDIANYQHIQSPIERLKRGTPIINNHSALAIASQNNRTTTEQDPVLVEIFDYASDLIWPSTTDKGLRSSRSNRSRNSQTSMIPPKRVTRLKPMVTNNINGRNLTSPGLTDSSNAGTPMSAELFDSNWTNLSHSSTSSINDTEHSPPASQGKITPFELDLEAQHGIQEILEWADDLDRDLPYIPDGDISPLEPPTWQYSLRKFQLDSQTRDQESPASHSSHFSGATKISKTFKRLSYQKSMMLKRIKNRPPHTIVAETESITTQNDQASYSVIASPAIPSSSSDASFQDANSSPVSVESESRDGNPSNCSQPESNSSTGRVKEELAEFIDDSKRWLRSIRFTRGPFTHNFRTRLARNSEPSLTSLDNCFDNVDSGPTRKRNHLFTRLQPYMTTRI
jgi:hypothetical protein